MKKRLFLLSGLFAVLTPSAAYVPPTMGWSSWNTYRVNISDALIRSQADAMLRNGLKEVGYSYINIDDGFFGGRDDNGHLLVHAERFPNGLAPVADYIHSLGFKAGIYSDAGRNTCGNYWDNDAAGKGVGFYGHDQDDADFYFKTLGFDFIKIDFCGGDPSQNSEHLGLDEKERYTAIRKAIDNTGKAGVRINVCRWAFPGTWVHDIGTSWRIATDISANWDAVKRIISKNRYLSAYATGGSFNDMDMLEIGRGLSPEEERTHFGMWCIQSSPLLIGCDMTAIPEASLRLIKNEELIAVNQDSLALQAYIVKVENGVYLYVKDVETLNGSKRVIAVYNPTDETRQMDFLMKDVDLSGNVKVRDLFGHSNLPDITDGKMSVEVPAHDTKIYKLEADERLERAVYEAETAWLERYQDIGMNQSLGYANYSESAACSGGAKAGWLGHHVDNWLEWRDVYSREGGVYEMTVSYLIDETRRIKCRVNDGETTTMLATAGTMTQTKDCKLKIVLKKGMNTVRLFNEEAWMPDIDKMTLKREDTPLSISQGEAGTLGATGFPKVVKLYNSGRLHVKSASQATASIWSISGIKQKTLTLVPGDNVVGGLVPGFYYVLMDSTE